MTNEEIEQSAHGLFLCIAGENGEEVIPPTRPYVVQAMRALAAQVYEKAIAATCEYCATGWPSKSFQFASPALKDVPFWTHNVPRANESGMHDELCKASAIRAIRDGRD